jgi:hypothetical protein
MSKMKLLKTGLYLLLIQEEEEDEIKEGGDYYLDGANRLFTPGHNFFTLSSFINKVIAYYPLKEAKELEGVPLLPTPFKKYRVGRKQKRAILDEKGVEIGVFKTGSELEAQKYCDYLNGKQFSLEDMRKAFKAGGNMGYQVCNLEYYYREQGMKIPEGEITDENEDFEDFIQSLSTQQLPKKFILGKGDTIEEQIKNGYYVY